jgi:hypothetical protein
MIKPSEVQQCKRRMGSASNGSGRRIGRAYSLNAERRRYIAMVSERQVFLKKEKLFESVRERGQNRYIFLD